MEESRGNGSLGGRQKGSTRSSSKHSSPSSQGQKPAEAEEGVAEVPAQNVPCGACKFLRRKCMNGCIFAPYFGTDQGTAKFAAVHKVFGASNVSKLLLHVPVTRRHDAVVTICFQAQARLADPVYGCISTILALQQQVASVQAELTLVHAHLMNNRYAIPDPLPSSDHHQHQQLHLSSHHPTNIRTTLRPAFFSNSSATSNIINIRSFPTGFDIAAAASSSPNLETLRFSQREEKEDDDEESIPAAFAADFLRR